MNRKEEIDKNAHEHFAHGCQGSLIDAYIEGAEWADEHPKEGLVDIERVCEYLSKLTYQEYAGGPMIRQFDSAEFEKFRKAMEK